MNPIILVMSGGAIGAALRYGLSRALPVGAAGWPWPTFVANVLGGLCMGVALAQSPPPQPVLGAPVLKPSSLLPLLLPPQNRARQPLFIQADHLSGRPDLDLLMLGDVQLRRADTLIRAERIDYFQPTDVARARGNVRINQAGNVFEGPDLDLKIEAFEGSITEPSFQLLRISGPSG